MSARLLIVDGSNIVMRCAFGGDVNPERSVPIATGIIERATRHSWTVKVYCETVAEAIALTQLTYKPSAFDVTDAHEPAPAKPQAAGQQQDLF